MKKLFAVTALAFAAVVLSVVLAGCGSEKAVSLGKPSTRTTTAKEQTGAVPTLLSLQVWFARDNGLVEVRRTHQHTPLVATSAINALLSGPTSEERVRGLGSAVPPGTKLLGIAIHDGVATVDLTSEYQSGAGARSMQMRLAQVVYTLTQFPTVQKVRFRLDGSPVNVFSSEGITLNHPVGRADYVHLLPAIVVGRPTTGESVKSPVTVSGTADVFEANLTVEVIDAQSKVVGTAHATASCGSGCRGTFSVPVRYNVSRKQEGTVIVHDDDAAGTGTPPHSVSVPVVLTP